MHIDISIYWLIFGVVCFALEAFGITGVGLFFAGLGALSLAVLMQLGTPEPAAFVAQFAWFFGFTAVWAALLWKPIKDYRMRRKASDYSNMVGDRGTVAGKPLVKGKEGKVKWSGTTMVAEICPECTVAEIAVGESVVIKDVKGNKLFVSAL